MTADTMSRAVESGMVLMPEDKLSQDVLDASFWSDHLIHDSPRSNLVSPKRR